MMKHTMSVYPEMENSELTVMGQHFKNSNYKQREAQHCGMIITDCITNTLQDVRKMQPTLQQKAHDLSLFSAVVNTRWFKYDRD